MPKWIETNRFRRDDAATIDPNFTLRLLSMDQPQRLAAREAVAMVHTFEFNSEGGDGGLWLWRWRGGLENGP